MTIQNYNYNHFTALWTFVLGFVRDNPGELVPEETFTHSHLSWSSIIPYLLHPSFTIHDILLVQFTCFGLPLGMAPSTLYSIHFVTQ